MGGLGGYDGINPECSRLLGLLTEPENLGKEINNAMTTGAIKFGSDGESAYLKPPIEKMMIYFI